MFVDQVSGALACPITTTQFFDDIETGSVTVVFVCADVDEDEDLPHCATNLKL